MLKCYRALIIFVQPARFEDTAVTQKETWIIACVIDTGPDISEEDRPNIFDRFYRGQAGRASGVPGTGLGLAICQEIVNRHGGQITADSELGKGSTFTVWLRSA